MVVIHGNSSQKKDQDFLLVKVRDRIGVAVYPKNPQIVYAVIDNNFHKPDTAAKKEGYFKICIARF